MPCWKVSCGRKVPPPPLFSHSGRTGLGNCAALFSESQFCHVVVTIIPKGLLAKFLAENLRWLPARLAGCNGCFLMIDTYGLGDFRRCDF